jgi:hypothetical protein
MQTLKSVAVGILFLGSTAGAATVERSFFGSGSASSEANHATCSCKGKGDCTCAKGQCKCKSCGNSNHKAKVFEALKGSNETTKLPDTARLDARGGVFI